MKTNLDLTDFHHMDMDKQTKISTKITKHISEAMKSLEFGTT